MKRPYPVETLKKVCRDEYLESRAIDAERHYSEQLERARKSEQERQAAELRRFGMIVR